jgi:hypothetical protein
MNQELDPGLSRLFNVEPGEPGLHLDNVRARAANNLQAFGQMVNAVFARQEVPVPPPVHLQWWPEGSRIKVVGGHPDRERIEVILNAEGDIVEEFKELELLHEIIHNAEIVGSGTTEGQHFNVGITSSGPVVFYTA